MPLQKDKPLSASVAPDHTPLPLPPSPSPSPSLSLSPSSLLNPRPGPVQLPVTSEPWGGRAKRVSGETLQPMNRLPSAALWGRSVALPSCGNLPFSAKASAPHDGWWLLSRRGPRVEPTALFPAPALRGARWGPSLEELLLVRTRRCSITTKGWTSVHFRDRKIPDKPGMILI